LHNNEEPLPKGCDRCDEAKDCRFLKLQDVMRCKKRRRFYQHGEVVEPKRKSGSPKEHHKIATPAHIRQPENLFKKRGEDNCLRIGKEKKRQMTSASCMD